MLLLILIHNVLLRRGEWYGRCSAAPSSATSTIYC